jgi:hypothetical protein
MPAYGTDLAVNAQGEVVDSITDLRRSFKKREGIFDVADTLLRPRYQYVVWVLRLKKCYRWSLV